MIWMIIGVIFAGGGFGGLVNALMTGELHLPTFYPDTRIYRPGWLGNVAVGGVAAVVFWGLYGPLASQILIGASTNSEVTLRVAEFFGALLTGLGGGRVLTSELDKLIFRRESEDLDNAHKELSSAFASVLVQLEKGDGK